MKTTAERFGVVIDFDFTNRCFQSACGNHGGLMEEWMGDDPETIQSHVFADIAADKGLCEECGNPLDDDRICRACRMAEAEYAADMKGDR